MRKLIVVAVILLVGALIFSGCAKPAQQVAQRVEPIKVGAILDLTGFVGQLGPRFKATIEMRLEEAGWQVAGRPIQLIVEDGASDSAMSLDKLKKLVERDNVKFIFGPLLSNIGAAIAPYLHQHGVLSISFCNDPIEIRKYENRLIYPGTLFTESMPLGKYAFEKLGYRTVTSLGVDYVAGWRYIGGALTSFKEAGGTVIQKQWFPPGTADYGPFLSGAKRADAFVFWDTDFPVPLKQYYDFGMKMPLLLPVVSNATEILPELGDKMLGAVGCGTYGAWIDNPLNKKFVAKFKDKFGRYPYMIDHAGYATATLLLAALEKTGGDTAYEKLRPAFLELNIDTIVGPVSFDQDGIAITNRYIMEVKKVNGEYILQVIETIPKQMAVVPPPDEKLRD